MTYKNKFDRREYDRVRRKQQYDDFRKRKDAIHQLLGGKCYLCSKKATKSFHLHHIVYHPIESNYPKTSKCQFTRDKRLSEAETHPERFRLLCPGCHYKVSVFKSEDIDKDKLFELLQPEKILPI